MTPPLRIAVIGCGAIADVYHLPALASNPATRDRLVLVDPAQERLAFLGGRYNARQTAADYYDILDAVDGAVIAAPHHLHHPIALDCLRHGVPVLCEKPLTVTAAAAAEMIAVAQATGTPLCVNQTRRLFPAYRRIRQLLAEGALGRLRSIRYADGKLFRWPTTSGFYFQGQAAHGVLLDKGVHGLDTICWWLDGRPDVAESRHDSFGGPEAVAHLMLEHAGCNIDVAFSWLALLHNSYAIVGERGAIAGDIEAWDRFYLTDEKGQRRQLRLPGGVAAYNDFGHEMIANFVAVIRGEAEPLVPAESVLPVVELIEASYADARPFELPWLQAPELFHA